MKKEAHLINQGAYGCIYKPGIDCKGKLENSKYITKIQREKDTSTNEINIGKYIRRKIKQHNRHFAPIVNSCKVSLVQIENNELKKCDILQQTKKNAPIPQIVSNKIRYVGKDALESYLIHLDPEMFILQLFDTHIYLLNSIQKLANANIVHFDLKENNIMYDTKNNTPIIIDFGLSFQVDQLTKKSIYERVFYIYYEKYPPWCLEIVIISFIIQQNPKTWDTVKPSITKIEEIIHSYFQNNSLCNLANSLYKIDNFKKKWVEYVRSFEDKTGEHIVQSLMSSWDSWDNFALCGIYLYILNDSQLLNIKPLPKFIVEYTNRLIENILSIPEKREKIKETEKWLKNVINNIDETEYNQWLYSIANKIKKETQIESYENTSNINKGGERIVYGEL